MPRCSSLEKVGLSFLGIKFTVYYSLFYFAGYTYGLFQEDIWNRRQLKQIAHVFVAICWGVWISLLMRYSIYLLPDSGVSNVRRVVASLTGGSNLRHSFVNPERESDRKGVILFWSSFAGNISDTLCLFKNCHRRNYSESFVFVWCGINRCQLYSSGIEFRSFV